MNRTVMTFTCYDRKGPFADEQLAEYLESEEGRGYAVEAMTGDRGCLIVVLRAPPAETPGGREDEHA